MLFAAASIYFSPALDGASARPVLWLGVVSVLALLTHSMSPRQRLTRYCLICILRLGEAPRQQTPTPHRALAATTSP